MKNDNLIKKTEKNIADSQTSLDLFPEDVDLGSIESVMNANTDNENYKSNDNVFNNNSMELDSSDECINSDYFKNSSDFKDINDKSESKENISDTKDLISIDDFNDASDFKDINDLRESKEDINDSKDLISIDEFEDDFGDNFSDDLCNNKLMHKHQHKKTKQSHEQPAKIKTQTLTNPGMQNNNNPTNDLNISISDVSDDVNDDIPDANDDIPDANDDIPDANDNLSDANEDILDANGDLSDENPFINNLEIPLNHHDTLEFGFTEPSSIEREDVLKLELDQFDDVLDKRDLIENSELINSKFVDDTKENFQIDSDMIYDDDFSEEMKDDFYSNDDSRIDLITNEPMKSQHLETLITDSSEKNSPFKTINNHPENKILDKLNSPMNKFSQSLCESSPIVKGNIPSSYYKDKYLKGKEGLKKINYIDSKGNNNNNEINYAKYKVDINHKTNVDTNHKTNVDINHKTNVDITNHKTNVDITNHKTNVDITTHKTNVDINYDKPKVDIHDNIFEHKKSRIESGFQTGNKKKISIDLNVLKKIKNKLEDEETVDSKKEYKGVIEDTNDNTNEDTNDNTNEDTNDNTNEYTNDNTNGDVEDNTNENAEDNTNGNIEDNTNGNTEDNTIKYTENKTVKCKIHDQLDEKKDKYAVISNKGLKITKSLMNSSGTLFKRSIDKVPLKITTMKTMQTKPSLNKTTTKKSISDPSFNNNTICEEIFLRLKSEFKEKIEWLQIQYKWVWLDCFAKSRIDYETIRNGIMKRMKNEYSVLRRIVEGDDVSSKYIVFLILKIEKGCLELFDGYYSVYAEMDKDLQKKVVSQRLKVFDKIGVVNAEMISLDFIENNKNNNDNNLLDNTDIFSISKNKIPIFRLCNNSVRRAKTTHKLGYQRKATFITPLKNITKTGGLVSCIETEIKEVLERKVLLKINNYKTVIDEHRTETEIQKLQDEIERNNVLVENSAISRFVVCRGKNDTRLTIWGADVKPGKVYRILNVKVDKGVGLWLSTTKKSVVVEKKLF